jgi:proline dehydrogenase
MASPLLTNIGIKAVHLSLAMHLPIKWLLKNTIFRQFCGGETLEETSGLVDKLGKHNVDTILDYGIEGKDDEVTFDKAVPEFIKAIRFAAVHQHVPFISLKITGFARFALLEKIHTGDVLNSSEREEWQRVKQRIDGICGNAAKYGAMILVDAEETWIIDPCNELTEAMMEKYNKGKVVVFNTYQLYCSGTLAFLRESIYKAQKAGYLLGAKLVRGAYIEKERKRAIEYGYPDPIQPDKVATDRDFDTAVELCLHHLDTLAVFIGSHNETSNLKAIAIMEHLKIPHNDKRIYFSQLLGMSDHISFNLAADNYNVSKYVPYGPVKDVIPYLMRRAQENTSVSGQTSRELELIKKEITRRALTN